MKNLLACLLCLAALAGCGSRKLPPPPPCVPAEVARANHLRGNHNAPPVCPDDAGARQPSGR